MRHLLQSVIGTAGPLIVEADGKLYFEHCLTIKQSNVDNMYDKIKDLAMSELIQTTDRSFSLTAASHPGSSACDLPCRSSTSRA